LFVSAYNRPPPHDPSPRSERLADQCAALSGATPPGADETGAALWQAVLTACVRPATVDGMRIAAFDYAQLTRSGGGG
jgi:hypothetical protein